MRYATLGLLLFIFYLGSCEKEPVKELPEYYNKLMPQDNELIRSAKLFGDQTSFSRFKFSEKGAAGNFYVVGNLNHSSSSTGISTGDNDFQDYYDPVLLKFDQNGNKLWEKRPGFVIQRFTVIPPGVLSGQEMIVVTGYDENETDFQDESPDRSRIMIFDGQGNFIDNYSRDFFLSLYDLKIARVTANYVQLVGVGSVFKSSLDDNYYPGFFEFKIRKNPVKIDVNSLTVNQLLESKWRHLRFWNLELSAGDYIVSGSKYKDKRYPEIHVLKFSPNNQESPIWWTNLNNGTRQIYHRRGGLHIQGQRAFVTGSKEDLDKGKAGGCTDCYWTSGFVASLDLSNGNIIWNKFFNNSDLSEQILEVQSNENGLFAVGAMARSWCLSCSQDYTIGNGWVLKLNPTNGELIGSRTFGDITFRTRLWSLTLEGNSLWGIGQQQYTKSYSKGLLLNLNTSSI